MQLDCLDCHHPLEIDGNTGHCATCQRDIPLEARCPDCHRPLQILKACGAKDFFCQYGHGLISSKRVEWAPLAS